MTLYPTKAIGKLVPRDYQQRDHDETFRLYAAGERGLLTRAFTGAGKTPMTCMKMTTWLAMNPRNHVLVVSYEQQLVWQFAQEIEDFVGLQPGIEMDKEAIRTDHLPRIVVASRQSLLRAKPPEQGQLDELKLLGIENVAACDWRACRKILKELRNGGEKSESMDFIREWNARPEIADGFCSRIHKFDWRLNWMVCFDEAHRHVKMLKSVGHIVDWFAKNPASWRTGMTATPKRGDQINVGHTMFPAISIDYPLYSPVNPCGVKDGWAVPYKQKYIEVEGVDFKNLKKIAGDFDPDELERKLGEEATLAKLIEPLLDMVGQRKTLIFSPGVEMAKNVSAYINARVQAHCPHCESEKWYARKLIGDGAKCPCGQLIEPSWVVNNREKHAEAMWGAFAIKDRKKIYDGHQGGEFQFLSVCGLCREGYNDPDIACVAVFRPVSKKASSLAEQMKGRGCRPCRAIVKQLNETTEAEERLKIISESEKPFCLIVDLVGITGLADCASTVQIYAEGLPDEVKEKAEDLLAEQGQDEEADVQEVIEEAKRLCAEEKEKQRLFLEEAKRRRQEDFEKRAKAEAEVKYTSHDVGHGHNVDSNEATEDQLKFIAFLGMNVTKSISKRQASRIIGLLKLRKPLAEVAKLNGMVEDDWSPKCPSLKQMKMMNWKRISMGSGKTGYDASQRIDAKLNPGNYKIKKLADISKARDGDELTAVALDVLLVKDLLPGDIYQELVAAGKEKRYSWLGDAAE